MADSSEQNGSYKSEWVREKNKLLLYRIRMGMSPELSKGDILPLLNRVWNLSFALTISNRKAVRDRGWYPANYMLLTDPDVLKPKMITPITNPSH